MISRIVLVSDDSDFFEYFYSKLILRRSDEVFKFNFEQIPEKVHLLKSSILIINSEKRENETIELLKLTRGIPSIVFGYNENEDFKLNVYKASALGFITPLTRDEEIQARIKTALCYTSICNKAEQYRETLADNGFITQINETFLDYTTVLDKELEKIKSNSTNAVLVAIAPNEKTKFLIQPNTLETIILNNIRATDILMSYATNKYFLILYNTNLDSAIKIWQKIENVLPDKVYAGFANIGTKVRQQVVNEVLNKLHETINYDKSNIKQCATTDIVGQNFKSFKQNFNKKIDQIITPVFYQIQQKYNDKLFCMNIDIETGDGYSILQIKSRHAYGTLKITSPGFSKINIDITYTSSEREIDSKRISLEPDELEGGLLEDLLEHFISDFERENKNANS